MPAMFLIARASSRSPHSRDLMVNVYIVDIHRLQCQVRQKNDQPPKRNTDGINVYIYIFLSISHEVEKKRFMEVHRAQIYFQISDFFRPEYCNLCSSWRDQGSVLCTSSWFLGMYLMACFIKWLTFSKLMTYRHKGICVFCPW